MLALGYEVVYILSMQIRNKSVRSITMTGKRVIWGVMR